MLKVKVPFDPRYTKKKLEHNFEVSRCLQLKTSFSRSTEVFRFKGRTYELQPSYQKSNSKRPFWQLTNNEKDIGSDEYGLYADLVIQNVRQRFRYIEPNTFMMGPPKDETGRTDYEDCHQVTPTQGYWLADTTCTQELWEAVMGENPSEFKDDDKLPIESVSWIDVVTFLGKVKQALPNLNAQLPTEAQWENACRAGTSTPFNFEGDIDLNKVNYHGTWDIEKDGDDYSWGEGATKETARVKTYSANHWGLYEMHGNVWEWCLDEWNESLGSEAVENPVNASFRSGVIDNLAENSRVYDSTMLANADDGDVVRVLRVLRGGSWSNDGRYCRSAIRGRL